MNRRTALLGFGLIPAALWTARPGGGAFAADAGSAVNQLTDAEKQAGWKLLFDGKSMTGWHNFKRDTVRPGWQVKDGTIACVDPQERRRHRHRRQVSTGSNCPWSTTSPRRATAASCSTSPTTGTPSGPPGRRSNSKTMRRRPTRNAAAGCIELYKPEIDPKTNKPLDATKPVGDWNHVRIVIAPPPAKSEVDINGVKYYDFVFKQRRFQGPHRQEQVPPDGEFREGRQRLHRLAGRPRVGIVPQHQAAADRGGRGRAGEMIFGRRLDELLFSKYRRELIQVSAGTAEFAVRARFARRGAAMRY